MILYWFSSTVDGRCEHYMKAETFAYVAMSESINNNVWYFYGRFHPSLFAHYHKTFITFHCLSEISVIYLNSPTACINRTPPWDNKQLRKLTDCSLFRSQRLFSLFMRWFFRLLFLSKLLKLIENIFTFSTYFNEISILESLSGFSTQLLNEQTCVRGC